MYTDPYTSQPATPLTAVSSSTRNVCFAQPPASPVGSAGPGAFRPPTAGGIPTAGGPIPPTNHLPQKNGFIHFDAPNFVGSQIMNSEQKQWSSTPPAVMNASFKLRPNDPTYNSPYPGQSQAPYRSSQSLMPQQGPAPVPEGGPMDPQEALQLHIQGDCKPCAYFVFKQDGCRWADTCQFCHLCTKDEIKRRKKEKVRQIKAQMRTTPSPMIALQPGMLGQPGVLAQQVQAQPQVATMQAMQMPRMAAGGPAQVRSNLSRS